MKKYLFFIPFLILSIYTVWGQEKAAITEKASTYVQFETNKGTFVVALYDGTPRHKENFLRNIRSKAYENTIFHRIIESFVVQGGNSLTKNATAETDVTIDTISREIPHEINIERFFHKKGALCAAREGNDVNPKKNSSTHQFYIVTGTFYTDLDLDNIEEKRGVKYSDEQRKAYKFYGGTPLLDNEYTVFGEIVSGMKVIDNIQRVKTDDINRPKKDIIIKKISIISKEK